MDYGQKALLEASFRRALTVADLGADLFSGRLYLLAPRLWHHLGVGDRRRQHELLQALGRIIDDLDRFDRIVGSLEAVARRAVAEGVTETHFEIVAETLIWTLQQVLGDAFHPSLEAAWRAICILLVEHMKHAAAAQDIQPSSLRKLRGASTPEVRPSALPVGWSFALRATRAEPRAQAVESERGRMADLPPPPPSARAPGSARAPSSGRAPASARISGLPLSSRLTPIG